MARNPGFNGASTAIAIVLCAGLMAPQAVARSGPVKPTQITSLGGDIDASRGAVDPFRGVVDPFRGEVNPFYGDLTAQRGVVDPFRGWVDPFRGAVDPFRGAVDPFRGAVDPFRGWVDPFAGQVEASRGAVDPFRGAVDPFRGAVDPFRGAVDPFYSEIDGFWRAAGQVWRRAETNWTDGGDAALIRDDIQLLVDYAEATWADQLKTTGADYDSVVADILSRSGFDLNDAQSFAGASAATRTRFMMDFYDTLMSHSGRNNADYWMNQVSWSPALTRIQESGGTATIGLLDATVSGDPDLSGRFGYSGGYDAAVGGHGASVASLMVGAHDGSGVMGIAPSARVVAHNPFDKSNSASWADVAKGMGNLIARDASVINMSLGIPGATLHRDWFKAFNNSRVRAGFENTVFVMAAGNDGEAQAHDVNWNGWWQTPSFILVGSVDANNEISEFSNTPGDACLKRWWSCAYGTKLMDRFVVAPGEMILLSDGEGGLTRQSGTSFAAPLVSGAVALLHSRWPWLSQHPEESADIILSTATDLGAPGTDPIYGRGLLNVRASQSPLDISRLGVPTGTGTNVTISPLTRSDTSGTVKAWSGDGFLHLFEEVGDTYRDFLVPLGDQFYGNSAYNSATGTQAYLQDYFAGSFEEWWGDGRSAGGRAGSGDDDGDDSWGDDDGDDDFTDVSTLSFASGDIDIDVRSSPITRFVPDRADSLPSHSEVRVAGMVDGLTVGVGHGVGAMSLMGGSGFAHSRDFRADENAVNPVLGFASGGGFATAIYEVDPFIALSGGISSTRVVHADIAGISVSQEQAYAGLTPYESSAGSVSVHLRPSSKVEVGFTYSHLDESEALLGVQSTQANFLDGGAATDGLTITVDAELGNGFAIAAAATGARTLSKDRDDRVTTGDNGIVSTAFQLSASKAGVFGSSDRLGFTVKQPLHREAGDLSLTQLAVIDRASGDIGEVRTTLDVERRRPFIAEVSYGGELAGGRLGAFGRADVNRGDRSGVMGGLTYRIGW
ncbi:MAG: S8 family peptidase [Pacificimonas sp.]